MARNCDLRNGTASENDAPLYREFSIGAHIKNSTFYFAPYVHSLKGSGVGKDTADSVKAEERKRIVLL
jgi:hypothetical protein